MLGLTPRQNLIRKYWSLHEKKEMTFHEVLTDTYIDKEMSIREVAREFGVAPGIIHKWLNDEGISKRKISFL